MKKMSTTEKNKSIIGGGPIIVYNHFIFAFILYQD